MQNILLAVLLSACPKAETSIKTDPLVNRLAKLPKVASVTVRGDGPKAIIHIADWHFVPREHFAAELPADATEAEIDDLYAEFLRSVAAVQAEQCVVLRELAPDRVWLERLTDEQVDDFRGLCDAMRDVRSNPGLLAEMMEADLTELGALARLIVDGHEIEVMPAENTELLELGFPLLEGFTEADKERREDEMVCRIAAAGESPAVLILGGGHDLSDNLPNGWRIVRVEVREWLLASQLSKD